MAVNHNTTKDFHEPVVEMPADEAKTDFCFLNDIYNRTHQVLSYRNAGEHARCHHPREPAYWKSVSVSPIGSKVAMTNGVAVGIRRVDTSLALETDYIQAGSQIDPLNFVQLTHNGSEEYCVTGTDTGMVRVFHMSDSSLHTELSLVEAHTNHLPAIYSWDEATGRLLVVGPHKGIKLWDTHDGTRVHHHNLEFYTPSIATSVCGDFANSLYCAGFPNAQVNVFDARVRTNNSLAFNFIFGGPWQIDDVALKGKTLAGVDEVGRIFSCELRHPKIPLAYLDPQHVPCQKRRNRIVVHSHYKVIGALLTGRGKSVLTVRDNLLSTRLELHPDEMGGAAIPEGTSIAFHGTHPLIFIGRCNGSFSLHGF